LADSILELQDFNLTVLQGFLGGIIKGNMSIELLDLSKHSSQYFQVLDKGANVSWRISDALP